MKNLEICSAGNNLTSSADDKSDRPRALSEQAIREAALESPDVDVRAIYYDLFEKACADWSQEDEFSMSLLVDRADKKKFLGSKVPLYKDKNVSTLIFLGYATHHEVGFGIKEQRDAYNKYRAEWIEDKIDSME